MRWGLTCALALAAGAFADRGGDVLSVVHSGLPHDALYDITFRESTGLAVGHHGLFLLSEDGGAQWRALQPLGNLAMLAVAASGDRLVLVGQQGRILSGTDADSLAEVDSPTEARLLSVAIHDSGLAVAVGGFGAVVVSEDGGATWRALALDWDELQPEGLEAHLYDVAIGAAQEILICGEFGMVLASRDRGATWEVRRRGAASLFAMHLDAQGLGFAVGQEGTVLRTEDGGGTWRALTSGSRANLLDVWHSKEGEVMAIGIRALLRSRDLGETWAAVGGRALERSWYAALAPGVVATGLENGTLPAQQVYAVGERGNILTINQ